MQVTDEQVVGTLSVSNYAMIVSNFSPRTTLTFNVHANAPEDQTWGTWTIEQDNVSQPIVASLAGNELASSPTAPSSGMSTIGLSGMSRDGSGSGSGSGSGADGGSVIGAFGPVERPGVEQGRLKHCCRVSTTRAGAKK